MKSTVKIALLAGALSTVLAAASIANADASPSDAQAQAAALLTGSTHFNASEGSARSESTGTLVQAAVLDAQSQARAIVSHEERLTANHGGGSAQKTLDAQSRAATVLLSRGA
jgi:hypothetical protein